MSNSIEAPASNLIPALNLNDAKGSSYARLN